MHSCYETVAVILVTYSAGDNVLTLQCTSKPERIKTFLSCIIFFRIEKKRLPLLLIYVCLYEYTFIWEAICIYTLMRGLFTKKSYAS